MTVTSAIAERTPAIADPRPSAEIERLYREHHRAVRAYLISVLRSAAEAEDATQEVFAKVVRSWATYDPRRGSARAWLFGIAHNTALSRLSRLRPVRSLAPDALLELREVAERAAPTRAALVSEEFLALVSCLPTAQRDVMVMRYVLDLDGGEIAAALGRSPGAVRQLHARGLKSLEHRILKLHRPSVRSDGRHPMVARSRPSLVTARRRLVLVPSFAA